MAHVDYIKREPQWKRVRDSIDGQDAIHAAGVTYLPLTGGMAINDSNGEHYKAYKARARFYDLVQATENGILGLAYNKDPIVDIPVDEESVTIDGKSIIELSRCQLRESLETGRGIMVVDAPAAGGEPYITEYLCEALTDWAVDDTDKSKLVAAKFSEEYFAPDDTYKEEPEPRIREYRLLDGKANVRVLNDKDEVIIPDIILPLDYLPIFFAGSVDTSPDIDPIPLLPIANAAVSIYMKSANYEHGMYMTSQGTHWVTGIDEDQWKKLKAQGAGSSSLWWLGDDGKAGILETTGNGTANIRQAIEDELLNAQASAVAMTEKGGVESAEALRLRSSAQHATIYTMMDSVSTAIEEAITCMAEWSGTAGEVEFALNADFSMVAASEQMLNALNSAVNAGNIPQSVMYEYIREAGLTEKTDEQLAGETTDVGNALTL